VNDAAGPVGGDVGDIVGVIDEGARGRSTRKGNLGIDGRIAGARNRWRGCRSAVSRSGFKGEDVKIRGTGQEPVPPGFV
jgi:hypothetical protein